MIRAATEDDIPGIRMLMQSIPGFWHAAWRGDVLERALRSADGLALVYKEDGRIVGFASGHDVGFRGYLSELAVAAEARGRGVGTALVRRVERELRARGCAVVIADVWREAEGFYRSLGWTPPDVILLRRRLAEGPE